MVILLTFVIAFLLHMLMPWWGTVVAAFFVALFFEQSNARAFLNGAIGVSLLWTIWIMYTNIINEWILSERLAMLFNLPSVWLVILLNILIGFLAGGLGGVTGTTLRTSFTGHEKNI